MTLRRMAFLALAGILALLVPTHAMAAFCFSITDAASSSAVGKLRVAPSAAAEEFTLLMGQFTNDEAFCPGGGGETAPGVGQFAAVSATTAHVSFSAAGTNNCFPVDMGFVVNFAAFPTMTVSQGNLDIPSLAALVKFNATTVDCATVPVTEPE